MLAIGFWNENSGIKIRASKDLEIRKQMLAENMGVSNMPKVTRSNGCYDSLER
jgi:hypothetical protein